VAIVDELDKDWGGGGFSLRFGMPGTVAEPALRPRRGRARSTAGTKCLDFVFSEHHHR